MPDGYATAAAFHEVRHEHGNYVIRLSLGESNTRLDVSALVEFRQLRFEYAISGFLMLQDLLSSVEEFTSSNRGLLETGHFIVMRSREFSEDTSMIRFLRDGTTVATVHLTEVELVGLRDACRGLLAHPDAASMLAQLQIIYGDI